MAESLKLVPPVEKVGGREEPLIAWLPAQGSTKGHALSMTWSDILFLMIGSYNLTFLTFPQCSLSGQ